MNSPFPPKKHIHRKIMSPTYAHVASRHSAWTLTKITTTCIRQIGLQLHPIGNQHHDLIMQMQQSHFILVDKSCGELPFNCNKFRDANAPAIFIPRGFRESGNGNLSFLGDWGNENLFPGFRVGVRVNFGEYFVSDLKFIFIEKNFFFFFFF